MKKKKKKGYLRKHNIIFIEFFKNNNVLCRIKNPFVQDFNFSLNFESEEVKLLYNRKISQIEEIIITDSFREIDFKFSYGKEYKILQAE